MRAVFHSTKEFFTMWGVFLNKKIFFCLIVLCVTFASIASVSAFWPFDSGSDVTVNGVDFHLPDGFDDVKKYTLDTNKPYEAFTYTNDENHEYIQIAVVDFDGDVNSLDKSLTKEGFIKETVDGKDGYGKIYSGGPRYGFVYLDGNKYVMINIPFVYADEAMQHEDLLAEIIK